MEAYFTPLWTFVYGIALGAVFLVMAMFNHWKTKREFSRYKAHLSDKLVLDAKQASQTNKDVSKLEKENENMRVQIARLNERSENKLQRELEIFARAEKQMLINAPGFAPAWELAKSKALEQLQSEETGESLPQRVFRKLLGTSAVAAPATTLPATREQSAESTVQGAN